MKGLYSEGYKTLMKEIKEDTDKQKGGPCSWTGKILLKCQYYQKSSVDSMQPGPRFQSHFYRSRKKNPKSYVELQKTSNSQSHP